MSTYFAVTSNTLQLGATADLYAAAGPAAVRASLSFDALLQYKPFQLQVDLTVSAAILLDGSPLMSLGLELHISGPSPWHIRGSAHFSILFFSFTVPINWTFGPSVPPLPPVHVDVAGELVRALADPHNWQTAPPQGSQIVTVRRFAGESGVVVHPLGSLTVRERVVPLGVRIDRFGADPLRAPTQLELADARLCGVAVPTSVGVDFFAPAQFITLSDDRRLSAPSFEQMTAGLTLGPAALAVADDGVAPPATPHAVVVSSTRQWDQMTLDSPEPPPAPAKNAGGASPPTLSVTHTVADVPASLLAGQLAGAAAALNGVQSRGSAVYSGPPSGIRLTEPTFAAATPGSTILGFVTAADGSPLARLPSYGEAVTRLPSAPTGGASPVTVIYSSEMPGSNVVVGAGA